MNTKTNEVPKWAIEVPEALPTEKYGTVIDGVRIPGLYDLMIAHPDKWAELYDTLVKQTGNAERAMAVWEEAECEASRSMQIDGERIELHKAIHTIRQAALQAAVSIARLEDELYDVDVADSPDTPHLKEFIKDIGKAGAAVSAILPFGENGDPK